MPTRPIPVASSDEIRDRASAFVGRVYRATTLDEVRGLLDGVALWGCSCRGDKRGDKHPDSDKNGDKDRAKESDVDTMDKHRDIVGHVGGVVDTPKSKPTFEEDKREVYAIAAWRCMVVKPGKTGLNGPGDFVVRDGFDDGGERGAGGRVLRAMQREGVLDAVVVVFRWFGGTLLGPVRFTHVETCASEVCRKFKKIEEMDECVQTLATLDDLLATLRGQLATTREEAGIQDVGNADGTRNSKAPDYRTMQETLDLTKAKRLVHARERAIENTKTLIEKYKTSM